MNLDNEHIEPVTELGLALGYSNQCLQRRFMSNDDSGAGANAGSGIHMTFVANNPLFELVWSPLKGPSNVALLPTTRVTGRESAAHYKHVDGGNFLTLNSSVQMKGQVSSGEERWSGDCVMPVHRSSHKDEAGIGGNVGEVKAVGGVSVSHINRNEEIGGSKRDGVSDSVELQMVEITENRENEIPDLNTGRVNSTRADIALEKPDHLHDETRMEPIAGGGFDKDRNADSSNHTLQIGFILTSKALRVNETEARRIEKVGSTSENDLHKYVGSSTNERVVLGVSPEAKGSSRLAEETGALNKTVMAEGSPNNSRILMSGRKGKERALSDGDLNGMIAKDEDDSHESVESCNSSRSFGAGKRRRNFEEDTIDENRGIKKQAHCLQDSASIANRDSSFMNWISNMMKGFSQSVPDVMPVPLSVVHPKDGPENPDKRLVALNKNQEPGSKITGFQSIFQSLYCTKAEVQETRVLNVEYQVGEASKFEYLNKTSNNNFTYLACPGENSKLGKQFFQLNEKFNESTSGNEDNSAMHQPNILLDKISGSQEKGDTNSEDNNTKCHLELSGRGKEIASSNSSLGKRKTKSVEQVDSEPPSTGKAMSNFCHRNDLTRSIWINRFSQKSPSVLSNPDHLNQSAGVSPKPSPGSLKLIPLDENHVGLHVDSAAREVSDLSAEDPLHISGRDSNNPARIKSHDDPMSPNKLIPVLPFPVVKPSGAMATVFAKRLDAFKNITSSRVTTDVNVTCFFCGVKGHNLQNCSEIAEVELEELVRNFNTYNGAEELSCLCIRCFQHNHWAVACPKASSTKCLLMESNASFSQMQISSGNKGKGDDLMTKTSLHWKVDEIMPLKEKRSSTSPSKKHVASSFPEEASKENRIVPLSLFVTDQNSNVPKGLVDAVKTLRLSRGDILKWINSQMSIWHIEGFFLRLRLGKWEEGLGGTGYHVACILGTQKDTKEQDTNRRIPVNVGGMNCLVESRYISNNDFLEDEIMAWWSITSRNGDKIPSEEELIAKVKTKGMLGF